MKKKKETLTGNKKRSIGGPLEDKGTAMIFGPWNDTGM